MINLSMQLKSIVFSFLYGILISLLFNINYFLLFHRKKIVKIFFSTIFVISFCLVYFYLLEYINYGYIHLYLLISFLVGFLLFYFPFKNKFRKMRVKK